MKVSTLLGVAFGASLGILFILAIGWGTSSKARHVEQRSLLPEAEGALVHVLLHWTPQTDDALASAYADFLRAIDAEVRVTLVIPNDLKEPDRRLLDSRLTAIDPTRRLMARVERVEVPGPITAWSKDRALVGGRDSTTGRARLIIPAEPSTDWKARYNDWLSVSKVVARYPEQFSLDASPFDFDAGDFAVGRGVLIFDANLLEKNRRRGYENVRQLAGRLGEYLRMQVVTLGEAPGDTPRHHLSMYMTPLTRNQVLVGDPRMAAAIVGKGWQPGEHGIESGAPLVADFSPEVLARFDRARADLFAQGFEVTSIVNVPFDDKTYLAYTNGVFEVRGGRHIAYVPSYGFPALDQSAHEVYRKLGWTVVPIRVRALFPMHGTIGCVVNVLARR